MLDWLFGRKKQQPAQSKPKQPQQDDKWQYQFLVQFLCSPIWKVTILDFVDHKCVVFDDEEENKFQYTTIHNEFKQLVGNLVDGMMEEIGLSQEKLAELIQRGFESKQKKIFNQLLLADDFLKFKQFMVKRNKQLEEEALKALSGSKVNQQQTSQLSQQREIIKESQRVEEERQRKLQQQEEQMIRKAIQLSKIQAKETEAIKELQSKVKDPVSQHSADQQKTQEKKQTIKQPEQKQSSQQRKAPKGKLQPLQSNNHVKQLPPLKQSQKPIIKENQKDQFQDKKAQNASVESQQRPVVSEQKPSKVEYDVVKKQTQPSESIEERKKRLMAQRQKIRKQKEEERRRHLEQKQQEQGGPVETIVLQDDGIHDTNIGQTSQNKVPEEELKRRKELMNRIKKRIVDDF